MKNIFKATLLFGLVSSVALTGCIEEVEPTDGVTQEQLNSSVKAGEATIFGIAANMVEFTEFPNDWQGTFGYPSMMHIRDLQLDEMICNKDGMSYNHWSAYEQGRFNAGYWMPQWIWQYYSKQILTTNKALATYPEGIESDLGKGARAKALAFRAMVMLDAARWFEYLPTDKTSSINKDGNDVLKLTIPIVTENTTEAEARNNPRAHHDKMVAFLLEDLQYAEENINKAEDVLKEAIFPNLAAVYGLMTRVYLWDEDYVNAATYARKAIEASGKRPLTDAEWSDPKSGFNTLNNNSWIWGMQLNSETSAVQTGICNFTSFVSPEATYGYANVGAYPAVGVSFYQRINNNDFRKLSWCPRSTDFAKILKMKINGAGDAQAVRAFCSQYVYAPVKFRPGEGDCTTYSVGSAVALPLMRVEEMYFAEIEAIAHTDAAEGKRKLEEFMNTYRMSSGTYTCSATSQEDIIEEIIFQKRVEFWGEGLNFFDFKRLGYKVTRAYAGTNFYNDAKFNTEGRPAWFNMPFVDFEPENNVGVLGWNNPDCDGLYTPLKDIE